MSHFAVGVIIPKDIAADESEIMDFIEDKMKPYDENMDVAPYRVECDCVGGDSYRHGLRMADIYIGTVDDTIRPKFNAWVKDRFGEDYKDHYSTGDEAEDEMDKMWKEMVTPFLQLRQETFDSYAPYHPDYGKPDWNCENCSGTGQRVTRYNPKSKWDYWVVGGRYNGRLYNKTGKPDDLADVEDDNLISIRAYMQAYHNAGDDFNTISMFAFVDKDGMWHERGHMGWWAMVSNEKDPEAWEAEIVNLLNASIDDYLVSLDCHI